MTIERLHEALNNGILNLSDIEQQIIMAEREELLARHPYTVYQGKDGSWYTYISDNTKKTKRRQIKRKTREGIEEVLLEHYRELEDNPTIKEVFEEWNERKLKLAKIKHSTFTRNEQIFKRHFDKFGEKFIKSVSEEDFSDFLEEQVVIFHLTAQGYVNLKSLVKGFLKRARKRNLIYFSVEDMLDRVDLCDRDFRTRVVDDEDEVFYDDEVKAIVSYCKGHISDINCVGVALMFATGLRVGEVVALRHCDILKPVIHVHATETRYRENDRMVFEVAENPKTPAGNRRVVVADSYEWVVDALDKYCPDREFIFTDSDGVRLHTQAVRKRLYQICEKLHIKVRSPHKARKTYGSILLDNGVDSKFIEKQMGHTAISCTEHYYHRDRRYLQEKLDIINSIPQFKQVNDCLNDTIGEHCK